MLLACHTPIWGVEHPLFLEFSLEVSTGPAPESPHDLVGGGENAFILHDHPEGGDPMLYPLRGRITDPKETPAPLWVGIRARRMSVEGGAHRSALHEAEDQTCEINSLAGLPPELFIPFTVHLADGDEVTVGAGEKKVTVNPGDVLVVASKSLKTPLEELARRLARPPEVTEESILARLRQAAPETKSLKIHTRLIVRHHGRVQVATFDALHEWEFARKEFAKGHFGLASAHAARVLEALPTHEGAVKLKERISAAGGDSIRGIMIDGQIEFPAGFPTEAHRTLWQRFNPGVARLTFGEQVWSAPVENGAFRLAVPPGSYRLELVVPGFKTAERDVTLSNTPLNLTIPLR